MFLLQYFFPNELYDVESFRFRQLLIGFGSPVIHGVPQDETVIGLTGLTGPAGISLRFNGFLGVIIGPILIISSGEIPLELVWI